MYLRPYQSSAIAEAREKLRAGAKRCLRLGTPVLRYDGRIVPVEDVRDGDVLMGPDSRPRRVLSTARGRGPLFQIVPIRGRPWVCTDVHVLTLVHTQTGAVVDIQLGEYLRTSANFRHLHKQFSVAVDFEPQRDSLPLDPYFFGVWLGDGNKRLAGVAISKPDPEILELCRTTAARFGLHVRTDGHPCPTHHLVGERGQGNPLLHLLRMLVAEPGIPHRYLTASRAAREALLAGLLDSDGYLHTGCFEIVQKDTAIAQGVAFIARSLGVRVLEAVKLVDGERYHRLSLSGDFSALPNRIPRKQTAPRRQVKRATRTGFRVQPIGRGEFAGFELTGDGRFLLGDFTVTRDTTEGA